MNEQNTPCMHFYCYLRKSPTCVLYKKYEKKSQEMVNKQIKRIKSDIMWTITKVTEEGLTISHPKKDDYLLDWDRFRAHWKMVA